MKKIIFLLFFMWPVLCFAGSQQTTPTNSTDIIGNVRAYLNEPNEDFWLDSELLVWINDGIMDVAARTRAMQTSENATLVANTLEYSLNTNFIGVNGAMYTNGTVYAGLKQSNPFDPETGIGSPLEGAFPAYWAEYGDAVWLWPVGDTVSGTVIVYLVERPEAILEGDNLPVPAIYDKAITLYVVAQALFKDAQAGKGGAYLSRYEAEINRFRADYVEMTTGATQ